MLDLRRLLTASALGIVAAASMGMFVLSVVTAGPARAAATRSAYDPSTDRTSWYWARQRDEVVEAGQFAQRVRLPSPQGSETLPVAASNNEIEKISAIAFDLGARGVPFGGQITRAVITIVEGNGERDFPAFNTEGKSIKACKIMGFWPNGEAEELSDAPEYDKDACVTGKRDGEAEPPTWTFDVTPLASTWGTDPSTAHGVMLVPELPGNAAATESTWQVNLRVPARDDDLTPMDEYKESKDRASIALTYTPPTMTSSSPIAPPPPASFDPAPPADAPPVGLPPIDGGTGGEEPPIEEGPAMESAAAPLPPVQMPAYMWALVPIGLASVAALRSVLIDSSTALRPGGALARIREFNAARRGGGTP